MADEQEEGCSIQHVVEMLKALGNRFDSTSKRLENLERWVLGDFSVPGKVVPGLVVEMQRFSGFFKWVIALLTTIATGVAVNAVVSLLHLRHS